MNGWKPVKEVPEKKKRGASRVSEIEEFIKSNDDIWEKDCSEWIRNYRIEKDGHRNSSDSAILSILYSSYRTAIDKGGYNVSVKARGDKLYLVKGDGKGAE